MRTILLLSPVLIVLAAGAWWLWFKPPPLPAVEVVNQAYATPRPRPEGPLRVYHLGHSLVGRDMPAMLAQLAGQDHSYESQLGWGTSLRQHWEPAETINGFETENDHAHFRPATEAVNSGEYDAVVLTEMVELRDAIRYHDSAEYFAKWADLARQANPDTAVYLYETWHRLDDPAGWSTRLDTDLGTLWENKILLPDLAKNPERPAHVIPAGQVMAEVVAAIAERDDAGQIQKAEDLFAVNDAGEQDQIHLNDIGNYLVALTHFAVLYGRSPVGLPHNLKRADGTPAEAPTPEIARLMQETVWSVVTGYPKTGVAP
ncbi:MAG: hypothetical protein AAF408_15140 [Pseudomonadota bacterium]